MKAFIFFGALVLMTQVVLADNDPRFTFEAANAAFAKGTAPLAKEVVGKWMLVGLALVSTTDKNSQYGFSGYWPDGKIPNPGISDVTFLMTPTYKCQMLLAA
jgi:hypothetical protein